MKVGKRLVDDLHTVGLSIMPVVDGDNIVVDIHIVADFED